MHIESGCHRTYVHTMSLTLSICLCFGETMTSQIRGRILLHPKGPDATHLKFIRIFNIEPFMGFSYSTRYRIWAALFYFVRIFGRVIVQGRVESFSLNKVKLSRCSSTFVFEKINKNQKRKLRFLKSFVCQKLRERL